MHRDKTFIAGLLAKLPLGELTPEEKAILEQWRGQSDANGRLYEKFLTPEYLEEKKERYESVDLTEGWRGFVVRRNATGRRRMTARLVGYAAVAALVVGTALFFLARDVVGEQETAGKSDGIILQLADGTTVRLDENSDRIVQKGAAVDPSGPGATYVTTDDADPEVIYNTIHVPCGRNYTITLSDGTTVMLNAMTTLRFPVRFGDGAREVELNGEAFFDVQHDPARPFTVDTGQDVITVLGTRFNVCSYEEDRRTTATLVDGRIAVKNTLSELQFYLDPNQQYVHDIASGQAEVSQTNVSYALAWMTSGFRFRDARMEDILTVLSRWYDLEVIYDDDSARDVLFSLNVPKYDTVDPLLRIFGQNGHVIINEEGGALRIRLGR